MNKIICTDIQTCIDNNVEINNILDEIEKTMELEYPDFVEWFKNILIPGLQKKQRNIILLFKGNNLIGFVNLKKTKKEKKLSNLYINSSFSYNKYFNLLINESINWLEIEDPLMIISNNELKKCAGNIINRNWHATRFIKGENNTEYYVINGYHDFKHIENLVKKKCKKKIYNH